MTLRVALFLLACTCSAQPSFEVASIKPNHSGSRGSDNDWGDGRISSINVPLRRLIAVAFEIREDQISGPDWLANERFDIQAKASSPVGDPEIKRMLQSLLKERFHLAEHRATRLEKVYALVQAKNGSKLKAETPTGSSTTNGTRGALKATTVSMTQFANRLSRMLELPVVDETEMPGVYSFKLTWDPAANTLQAEAPSDAPGPSIFEAIQQQLGLKLEAKRAPVEIMMIDHVDRVPSEN